MSRIFKVKQNIPKYFIQYSILIFEAVNKIPDWFNGHIPTNQTRKGIQ